MFTLEKTGTVWATVKGDEPSEDGKRRVPWSFDIRFKRMDLEALRDWTTAVAASGKTNVEALSEVILEFRDLRGPDGQPAEFNPETLRQVLNWVGVDAFLHAMREALPKAKN